jgi:ADP-heptose:LPS heptosyltransferase
MAVIPALRSLRTAFPSARIEVLALRAVEPILGPSPHLDELVLWSDYRHKGTRLARAEKVTTLTMLAARLRPRGYGAVLVMHRSFRAMRTLAGLLGATVRAGVSDGSDGYTHVAPPALGVESSRSENRRVLAAIGVEEDGGPVELWTGSADREHAAALLGRREGPLVGIHPGSDWSCQQWLPERFGAVGATLQRSAGARIVLTGSVSESALQDEIADHLGPDHVRAAGRTTFGQLVEVIRGLDLLVGVNSAAAAIARAVGTPSVVLLGPEDRELTGIDSEADHRVLQPGGAQRPGGWCELGRWGVLSGCESPMCRGIGGLDRLDAGEVADAARSMLIRRGRSLRAG